MAMDNQQRYNSIKSLQQTGYHQPTSGNGRRENPRGVTSPELLVLVEKQAGAQELVIETLQFQDQMAAGKNLSPESPLLSLKISGYGTASHVYSFLSVIKSKLCLYSLDTVQVNDALNENAEHFELVVTVQLKEQLPSAVTE